MGRLAIFSIAAVACAEESISENLIPETKILGADLWYRSIGKMVPTGDGQGYGPDIGSGEWRAMIKCKLGIQDKPNPPSHDSEA